MTTIFETVSNTVTIGIAERMGLYLSLQERPEVKDNLETLQDILTLFNFELSIIHNENQDDKKLEDRIDDIIEDYYRRLNKGSSTVVGVTPADRLRDELDDLVHTISPHLEKEVWVKFFLDLPNDKFTKQDFVSLQEDHLMVVKTCLLTVIKSSNLWVKISIMMKSKGKGNKPNDPANQTTG